MTSGRDGEVGGSARLRVGLTLIGSLFGLTLGRRPEIIHEVIDGTPVTKV